jgi:hypothetical protein
VVFKAPPNATAEELQQLRAVIDGSNDALAAGYLSPLGRVSTKGELATESGYAATLERARAAADGDRYLNQQAGHVPYTTWINNSQPWKWEALDPRVNRSLGGQAPHYPIGYRPSVFILNVGK